ncbi:hypothetical protein [Leekyejoonella antrihumi]|uniref:hypothetical protein n=1 Tax=Leekyejoonella antrihumi TaxID=1660198 RepID=UPI0016489AC9|nr:hypothetical protein [Leekyejoonella antrihumi]
MIEVTRQYCPASGVPEGQARSTHHLVPRRAATNVYENTCVYCDTTEKTLRAQTHADPP